MINVMHKKCGNIAFYFKNIVNSGDIIRSTNITLLDGSIPKPGSIPICGSCNQQISFNKGEIYQQEQSWKDWFIIE